MAPLPVFTRYLYLKNDAISALRASLLNKDKESSYFWASELCFSGFLDDTISELWEIYFQHYASSNVTLETYLKKKETIAISDKQKQDFMCLIISNLLKRDSTTDVYMLNKVTSEIYADEDEADMTLNEMLNKEKFEALCHRWCSATDKERKDIINVVNTFFTSKNIKIKIEKKNTNKHVNSKTIFITRLIQGFTTIKNLECSSPKKKQQYVVPDSTLLEQHKTKERDLNDQRLPYKIYKDAVKFSPNQYNIVSMNRQNISDTHMDIWRNGYKWIPIAAKTTPVWRERVEQFGKLTDDEIPSIVWNNDDDEEGFYEKYWYDTEEQPMEIQNRVIPRDMEKSTLFKTFQEKHNTHGLYKPCEEVLTCLDE